ncbi:hypothetical protein STRCI_006530 [Streptomyces cinnabarinus]|uniref:Nucleotidyltransferase family protein n=1 Tax=Streptomyces cinnabarinus TaxID=67287 RepID=A0ABY7KKI3_9ACTN|nr:hypothetical protein [Streptomyces cinnabarinus]WAZ25063.1 hypothetical protein STRCI_006530 [Streptomyces cinnabarinus]
MTAPTVDLAFFRRLFDLHEDESPRAVVEAAGRISPATRMLVVTAAVREGVIGTGSADEVRRLAERTAFYSRLRRTAEPLGARPVKGFALAPWYPDDLPRPMNDIDLVVPDRTALWRVVGALAAEYGPTEMDLTMFGAEGRHFLVTLSWPAADPLLDYDPRVEIFTCALTGDGGAVPLRPRLPDDPVAAGLLAVAEERFERPFNAKDLVDVMMTLTPERDVDIPRLARLADEFRLAPELLELLRQWADVDPEGAARLDALFKDLDPAAVREVRRREEWLSEDTGPSGPDDPRTLHYGMRLTPVAPGPRPGRAPEAAEPYGFEAGSLLLTPVADFLLVPGELVAPALYEAALTALADLGPRG